MITIFRLEHLEWKQGVHTYFQDNCSDTLIKEYLEQHDDFNKYPTLYESFVGIPKPCWHCCCESLEQLFYWFTPEFIAYAQDYGFYINIYRIREKSFKKGFYNKQCFFVMKEAKFVKSINIFNL